MKTETAMGFAASEAGITTDQAEAVVRTYLASLSMCPACEGEGNVAWRYDASIDLEGGTKTIPAGTRTPCPNCGGMGTGRGLDPANVAWVCLLGTGRSACSRAKQEMDPTHGHCGFRLALDIPEAPQ